jgi:uncharacterized SAM-binding protein YcdF (DUF218 family)
MDELRSTGTRITSDRGHAIKLTASYRRRILRFAVAALLALALVISAGIPVYVRPQIDSLRKSDAIYVLGGSGSGYLFGVELAKGGWAPTVVLSGGFTEPWLWPRCWRPSPPVNIVCIAPHPQTTLGEAHELRLLAAKYGWRRVVVVTSRPHISRARFILERCFAGELIMVESPAEISIARWAYEYVYQTAGYVKALANNDC